MLSSFVLLISLISTSLPVLASVIPQDSYSLLERDAIFAPATHRSVLEASRRGTRGSPSFPFEDAQLMSRQATTGSDLPVACESSCTDEVIEANTPACVSSASDASCTCAPTHLADVDKCLTCVEKEDPNSDVFLGPGGEKFTVEELVSALQSLCDTSLPTITESSLVTTGRSSEALSPSSTGREGGGSPLTAGSSTQTTGAAAAPSLRTTTAGGGTGGTAGASTPSSLSAQGKTGAAGGKVEVGNAFSVVVVVAALLTLLA